MRLSLNSGCERIKHGFRDAGVSVDQKNEFSFMQIINQLADQRKLAWYNESNPQVSIIILNYNKSKLTIECLQSLWENTQGYSYEIIVVDNGSRAEEFNMLAKFAGTYKLLRLEINRFFGEGNNIAVDLAQGEFLLFMNNDVTVMPNWLPPLMRAFATYPDCGAAGPKFVFPNGLLQEAGALIDEQGESIQIGIFQDPDVPHFNCGRVVDYVSAATLLMQKKMFDDVLGFDFIYEPAYYEDVDLCFKIGQLGFKTYYVPESCVIHHANATTSDSFGTHISDIIEINRKKFVSRWAAYLKTGIHQNTQSLLTSLLTSTPLIRSIPRGESVLTAAVYYPNNIIPESGKNTYFPLLKY